MAASTSVDEEELFAPWSSSTSPAILVDGVRLNEVFSKIRNQIEFLRKQQLKTASAMANRRRSAMLGAGSPANRRKSSMNIRKTSSAVSFAGVSPENVEDELEFDEFEDAIDNQQFEELSAKVEKLEKGQKADKMAVLSLSDMVEEKLPSLTEKLSKVTESSSASTYALQEQINRLAEQNKKQDDATYRNMTDIEKMKKHFEDDVTALQEKMERQASAQEQKHEELLKNFKALETENNRMREDLNALLVKIHELRDINSMYDLRLKKAEASVSMSSSAIFELRANWDALPSTHLQDIRNNINDLFFAKAGKEDLLRKADITLLEEKAGVFEVQAVRDTISELARKINLQNKDLHDGFGKIDRKLDKKTDLIAQWCLRQVRKEIKGGNFDSDHRGDSAAGTDIGKVRCLVCDQPVTQQTRTEIVFGGPSMKSHLRSLHDTHQPRRQDNNSPSPERTMHETMPSHQPNQATTATTTTARRPSSANAASSAKRSSGIDAGGADQRTKHSGISEPLQQMLMQEHPQHHPQPEIRTHDTPGHAGAGPVGATSPVNAQEEMIRLSTPKNLLPRVTSTGALLGQQPHKMGTKLARLGAIVDPSASSTPLPAPASMDDSEYMHESKYRQYLDSPAMTLGGGRQAQQGNADAVEMLRGSYNKNNSNHGNSNNGNNNRGYEPNPLLQKQNDLKHFKDLEERFAVGARRSFSGASSGSRPTSAPAVKRSASGKLAGYSLR